ncbi:hypothetical protein IOD13_16310 [Brevibacterium casei]|nr:hypothetical protein [Brevibacterium casei]
MSGPIACRRPRPRWMSGYSGALMPSSRPQCGCVARPARNRVTAGIVSARRGPSVRESTSMRPPQTAKTRNDHAKVLSAACPATIDPKTSVAPAEPRTEARIGIAVSERIPHTAAKASGILHAECH